MSTPGTPAGAAGAAGAAAPARPRVLVVGGGVSGLAAAHRLLQRGAQVEVLEASPRTGGVLQ
ncbi:FAD-dependent oxidoreductase, partial [Kineococcus indalonis]|uniref:FAD-dependent oxidoreductase n=1 Tax=Kineococcus indalonis TaxID=2696566 RepID=UPI001412699A